MQSIVLIIKSQSAIIKTKLLLHQVLNVCYNLPLLFYYCCPVLAEEESAKLSFQNVQALHIELGVAHVLQNASNEDVLSSQTQLTVQMVVY